MQFDEASKALVEFATSRHNAFHSSEVADIISPQRLRRAAHRGELTEIGPRVWSIAALGSPPGQLTRAAVVSKAGAASAHLTAVWLHGWCSAPPTRPSIWVPGSARTDAESVHRLWASRIDPARDITEVDHIPTLNPAATLCLLGRVAPREVVGRYLDEFRRDFSMVWLVETLARLRTGNCRGVATLDRILDDPRRVDGVTDSWFERLVADLLSQPGLPPLELQHPVRVGSRGHKSYRIDVAFPSIRLGIEAHSREHHWGLDKTDADNRRDLALTAAGWQLLYVTWSQIQDPATFVRDITRVVAARTRLFAGESGQ